MDELELMKSKIDEMLSNMREWSFSLNVCNLVVMLDGANKVAQRASTVLRWLLSSNLKAMWKFPLWIFTAPLLPRLQKTTSNRAFIKSIGTLQMCRTDSMWFPSSRTAWLVRRTLF